MGKARLPVKREPRQQKTINDRQDKFARVYAATLDADEALKQAGYEHGSEEAARDAKCRLLRNPAIRSLVDDLLAKSAAKYGLDTDGILARLKMVYLEAAEDREWASAVAALREIGKILGCFEIHNKQKRYTSEDAEKLQQELTQAGFDFTRVNDRSEN